MRSSAWRGCDGFCRRSSPSSSSGDDSFLKSHRREITVVFCDLRGFTSFAETVEPEDVMAVLSEYHAALGDIVYRFDGTLERFIGDGIMVIFNDPLPCEDAPKRAVRMALAMRGRVAELAEGWSGNGYELDFGVGIALRGVTIDDLFDVAVRHRLHFDQARQTGVVFHMMGALGELGRVGLTAVGDGRDQADEIYRRAERIVREEAAVAPEPPLPPI